MNSSYQSELKKYITFQIASYWYVIPTSAVLKILHCPPVTEGKVIDLGIIQLGPHTIRLIDINQIFEHNKEHTISKEPLFLLVFRYQENTFFGITLSAPPDLIDLTPNILKSVSLQNRFNFHNPWISHVGVTTIEDDNRTLLELDLERIFQQELENSI